MTGPILIFGGNGQVGWALTRSAEWRNLGVVGLCREDADITDLARVVELVCLLKPALVVNAAAYTAVDKAESEPDKAFAANRDGARNVARAAAESGAPLVHLSTDYVFDGTKQGAWTEDDPVRPLNVYGSSKAAGEDAVREACARHIILRTSWVYGPHGSNFVRTMLRLARERDQLGVVSDQHGCPTATTDIAEAILDIGAAITRDNADDLWGTYHFCGAGQTTWFGFAKAVFDARAQTAGPSPAVFPVSTAQYPTPAQRPLNSVLDCSRLATRFGVSRRPWRSSLQDVLHELIAAPQ